MVSRLKVGQSVMPSESTGWKCAREALAEVRAYPSGLQTFVSSMFDQLDGLTDRLLAHELAGHQAEQNALRDQIDRLASVAAELTEAVAEQKQLVARKNGDGRGNN
jgi:hypothetical protein